MHISIPGTSGSSIQRASRSPILPHNCQNLWELGHSPINCENLNQLLSTYPNIQDAHCLSLGFKFGFSLNFDVPRRRVEFKNMKSAMQYTFQIQEKIDKEVKLGRIMGPFLYPPIYNLRCNSIDLVPQKTRWLANDYEFVISNG